jgi:hypothetical protein
MNSFFFTVGAMAAHAVLSAKHVVLSAASSTRTAGSSLVAGYQAERNVQRVIATCGVEVIELHDVRGA